MVDTISANLVEKWLTGWSLSRELPVPVRLRSGLRVDVGYEKQKTRYVFTELSSDFVRLSKLIADPWVYLKVCASAEDVKNKITAKWTVEPQRYMMSCFHPMTIPDLSLPDEYTLKVQSYNSTFVVRIYTQQGELASTGHVVLVDDLAVYDRISTESNHRRKGLATILMKELEKIALSKGVFNNFLVATEEGKSLYQSLGWKVYCLYTSAVIAGKA